MVFMLFPVSALADGDAAGDPSAEEVTRIAEGAQSDPEENSGETPEEKAEENTVHENTVHRAMEKVGDLIHTEKMIRAGYCLDGL